MNWFKKKPNTESFESRLKSRIVNGDIVWTQDAGVWGDYWFKAFRTPIDGRDPITYLGVYDDSTDLLIMTISDPEILQAVHTAIVDDACDELLDSFEEEDTEINERLKAQEKFKTLI